MYTNNISKFNVFGAHITVVAVALSLLLGFAASAIAESPIGCSADNSIVNISTDKITAEAGDTITFSVSAGNPASVDGCDIEDRTLTLTLPDGSVSVFGPDNYPNPTAVAVIGSVPYIADESDLVNGLWTANVAWNGTLKAVGDLDSSGSKNVSVNQVEPLEVSKTAVPSFGITHRWTIEKSVDVDSHDLLPGQSATSTYTVTLDKTTVEDGYFVNGVITIFNPNDVESATIDSVDDVISGYGDADSLVCDETLPFVLGPGETLECTYSSALPDDTARTNTATVVVSEQSLVDGGSGEAAIDFTGVNPEVTGFDTITTVDTNDAFADQNGGNPVQTSDDVVYNYDVPFMCDEDEGEHPNTATIVETDQSDDVLVTVSCASPSISVDKTGDDTSKVGDDVTYTYTITNNGDTTLYLDSVVDDVIGDITNDASSAGCDTLASNEDCQFEVEYTVQGGDPDPLVNEVVVTYNTSESLDGVEATDSDTHSVSLFQPSVVVTKTGPSEAAVGDEITYEYTIENTSSSDAPDLVLVSVTDDVIGDLTTEASNAGCDVLNDSEICNFSVDYTIQGDDPNPLVNVVDVLYNPDGFPNEIIDSDDHSVTIEQVEFAGCTPGYWKNHLESWDDYDPSDLFSAVFSADPFDVGSGKKVVNDPDLLEALNANGGGISALARHATAALLNAAHSLVSYPMSESAVIDLVQDAIESGDYETAKNILADNNEIGCSIDAHNNPIE